MNKKKNEVKEEVKQEVIKEEEEKAEGVVGNGGRSKRCEAKVQDEK